MTIGGRRLVPHLASGALATLLLASVTTVADAAGPGRQPAPVGSAITATAFNKEGTALAVARADGSVEIVDPSTGASRWNKDGAHGGAAVVGAVFVANGRLATAGRDSVVRLWNEADGSAAGTLQGHSQPLTAIAASADGGTIVSGAEDTSAIVWNASGKLQQSYQVIAPLDMN